MPLKAVTVTRYGIGARTFGTDIYLCLAETRPPIPTPEFLWLSPLTFYAAKIDLIVLVFFANINIELVKYSSIHKGNLLISELMQTIMLHRGNR